MSKSYYPTERAGRIDWHNNFAKEFPKVGEKLDTGAKFDANNYRAELGRPRQTGNVVTIPFRKAGGNVDGINLYLQRKGEISSQKVGFFMRTPAVDGAPGKSGQITYTARAVVHGKEIGQPSDAVTVTLK